MKTQVYLGISIRIIALFAVGMLGTFIPDNLREFFGDVKRAIPEDRLDGAYMWGARHYWYFWMMFILFVLSLVNVAISIHSLIKKHYPDF